MSIENYTYLRLMVFTCIRIRELILGFKCYTHHICRQDGTIKFLGDTGYIKKIVGYRGLRERPQRTASVSNLGIVK